MEGVEWHEVAWQGMEQHRRVQNFYRVKFLKNSIPVKQKFENIFYVSRQPLLILNFQRSIHNDFYSFHNDFKGTARQAGRGMRQGKDFQTGNIKSCKRIMCIMRRSKFSHDKALGGMGAFLPPFGAWSDSGRGGIISIYCMHY